MSNNTTRPLDLIIFGATRNTGFHAMQQALAAGHRVTAVIRDPSTFQHRHDSLTIVKGDATQVSTFMNEMHGKDAVISSLGATDGTKPTTLCSDGVSNMLLAMQAAGVKRIICVSASAIELNGQMNFFIRTASRVLQRILKYPYEDLRIMERILARSDRDWTVVRPPRLKDNPVTGRYRVSAGGHLKAGYSIGRQDLAHYILHHLTDAGTFGKIVEVAY
ncbi:MAG: family oxidoreductase [Bacteroidetes bacterium]|nr:family oxidoreductase [Bacteroidota bacterium]